MPPQKIIIKSRSSTKLHKLTDVDSKGQLIEKNKCIQDPSQLYFDHLSGQCACVLCNCGKHKCNGKNFLQKQKCSGGKTTYQCEFVSKTPENDSQYNQNLFTNPKAEKGILGVTTYKHDYPGYLSQVRLQKGPNQLTTGIGSFSGLSTYGNMFKNWGVGDSAFLLPQNNPTVIQNLPFCGRSNYRDCFQEFHVKPAQSTKGLNQLRSPLSPPNVNFFAISVSKSSFLPLQSDRGQLQQKKQNVVLLNPSFKGQYNTVYCREFDSKQPFPCPAKELFLENEQF